jgi:protein-tyrosine-phosphatase
MNLQQGIRSVLFVCTGNTCRSPMAEGLLKVVARSRLKIASAGIFAGNGGVASQQAVAVMRDYGVDIACHVSQRLSKELAVRYDLIIALEQVHKEVVVRLAPEKSKVVFLLKEFCAIPQAGLDVSDPVGLQQDFYRSCAAEIKLCVDSLWRVLQDKF